jgi:hypothetical protein
VVPNRATGKAEKVELIYVEEDEDEDMPAAAPAELAIPSKEVGQQRQLQLAREWKQGHRMRRKIVTADEKDEDGAIVVENSEDEQRSRGTRKRRLFEDEDEMMGDDVDMFPKKKKFSSPDAGWKETRWGRKGKHGHVREVDEDGNEVEE